MEIQDQIYLLTGVFAAIGLLVLVLVGYLMYRVAKITEHLVGNKYDKRDTYAYNNPTILPGEELNRRGFTMQQGSEHSTMNREPMPMQQLNRTEPNIPDRSSRDVTKDFSNILNNNEMVFGGEIKRAKLKNRSFDPDFRQSNYNNNFSFQSSDRPPSIDNNFNNHIGIQHNADRMTTSTENINYGGQRMNY